MHVRTHTGQSPKVGLLGWSTHTSVVLTHVPKSPTGFVLLAQWLSDVLKLGQSDLGLK